MQHLSHFDSKFSRQCIGTCASSRLMHQDASSLLRRCADRSVCKIYTANSLHRRTGELSESNRRSIWKFVVIKRLAKRSSPAASLLSILLQRDSLRGGSHRSPNRFTWIAFDWNENHAFWFIQRLESTARGVCWVCRIRRDLEKIQKMRLHRLPPEHAVFLWRVARFIEWNLNEI